MDDQIFTLSLALIAVLLIATFFYCLTLFKILQQVPKENQLFPSWFVWLFLVPWVGLVFQFIMLPFGIPSALKKTFATNQDAIASADILLKLGLAQVILILLGIFLPVHPINQIISIFGLGVWIAYWVMIVRFKKQYLTKNQ